jgi:uncharacterized protein
VTHSRYPLRINVGFLVHQPIGTSHDFEFDLPAVQLSPDFELMQFSGKARISRTPQGLLVEADFTGNLPLECVRCLDEFQQTINAAFTELFTFRYRRDAESELYIPEDGHIDLAPLARDYLLVEQPIKPICRPNCKGLCSYCGVNLNETSCEHQTQLIEN